MKEPAIDLHSFEVYSVREPRHDKEVPERFGKHWQSSTLDKGSCTDLLNGDKPLETALNTHANNVIKSCKPVAFLIV